MIKKLFYMEHGLVPSEKRECNAFWKLAQYHPILRDYIIHIPNEGKRSIAHIMSLQAMGFRAGVPDYVLIYPNNTYHSLWFDMKKVGTNVKRQSQEIWIQRLTEAGHYATYAYGAEHAYNLCLHYLANTL